MDDFNAVQKRYLSTCLKICSTPEVDKIDSECMNVDAMTKKEEVIFVEECKRLLDICDEIGTNSDKIHAKHKAPAHLKHKYYWVNIEEYILYNGMKAVYKILNNQDKVTTKKLYHIIWYPDL